MPTYQYACTDPSCANRFELVQSFTDPAASECPVCGGPVRKVYGSVGVVFKGSGFYRTDSRSRATDSAKAESDSASPRASRRASPRASPRATRSPRRQVRVDVRVEVRSRTRRRVPRPRPPPPRRAVLSHRRLPPAPGAVHRARSLVHSPPIRSSRRRRAGLRSRAWHARLNPFLLRLSRWPRRIAALVCLLLAAASTLAPADGVPTPRRRSRGNPIAAALRAGQVAVPVTVTSAHAAALRAHRRPRRRADRCGGRTGRDRSRRPRRWSPTACACSRCRRAATRCPPTPRSIVVAADRAAAVRLAAVAARPLLVVVDKCP